MKNILYTGTNPEKYEVLGNVIHHPMIAISAAAMDKKDIENIKAHLAVYDMLLFTSRFGVQYFFALLEKENISLDQFANKEMVVIGHETAAALKKAGLKPDLEALDESSLGLLTAMKEKYGLKDKSILFPRSSMPNPFLEDELTRLGSLVQAVTVYKNTKPAKRDLPKETIDKVIFTSPSTVRNFLDDYGDIPDDWLIYSRGRLTSRILQKAGYSCVNVNVLFK